MTPPPDPHEPAEDGDIGPYLGVVVVALVIALGLTVYVLSYRDQIVAILTKSPT